MELTHLRAKNFQSFKELYYEFRNGEPVLIQGENLTDSGQESNGSGKSALMSIVEYCILHTTSKKVTDANLVFWWDGDDQSELELGIYCPIRKETLLVERVISIKNGGRSQLSINGIPKYKFDDKMVNEIDRFIIEWIGISKEDLQNFFILSKFKYISFFNASNTNLIQLIGRFSNSSIIAGLDKDIMSKADTLEESRSILAERKSRLYGMIDVHKANIEKEKTVDKEQLVQSTLDGIDGAIIDEGDKIIHYHTQIGIANDEIARHESEVNAFLQSLDKANKDLTVLGKEEIFDTQYAEIDKKVSGVKATKDELDGVLTKLNAEQHQLLLTIQEIDRNIQGAVKCPNCGFEFLAGKEDVNIEEEKSEHSVASTLLEQLGTAIEEARNRITQLDPKIKELRLDRLAVESKEKEIRGAKRNLQTTIDTLGASQRRIQTAIDVCNNNIIRFKESIKGCEARVRELQTSKEKVDVTQFDNTARIEAIDQEIEKCDKQIADVEREDEEIRDQIVDIKTWSFTFKEFHQYLSVKTIKVLQGYANKFLEDIGSDLRVQLEGYKLKSDGTLSEKITAYIIRDGEMKEYGNFSGGERVRLEAAMILTIQHAINSTHPFGGLNFLSIDEIFESADGLGVSTLTSSLMNLGKTILITTHIPGNNYECETLKIVKEHRISRIQTT